MKKIFQPAVLLFLTAAYIQVGYTQEKNGIPRQDTVYELDHSEFDNSEHEQFSGDWIYTVQDDGIHLKSYRGTKKSVVIPSDIGGRPVTYLGSFLFGGEIDSLTVPATVTFMESNVLRSLESRKVRRIHITGNPVYEVYENGLYDTRSQSLFACLTDTGVFSVRPGTKILGPDAFKDSHDLSRIILPDSLKKIWKSAFTRSATAVEIPASVEDFPAESFYMPTNMTVNPGNAVYEVTGGCFYNKRKKMLVTCFSTDELSYTVKPGTKEIDSYAFYGCTRMETICIPDSVMQIGSSAFTNCRNLKTVKLPAALKILQSDTFYNDENLTSVTLNPELEEIRDEAFFNCKKLMSLSLSEKINYIAAKAFYGCRALMSATVDENSIASFIDRILSMTSSESAKIKPGITIAAENPIYTIRNGCLYDRKKRSLVRMLRLPENGSFTVPAYVKEIGPYAFSGTPFLRSVKVPGSVKEIGESAFSMCAELRTITLGNGIETIGDDAFEFCPKVSSITIPASVTEIGSEWGCRLTTENDPAVITVDSANPYWKAENGNLYRK